MSSTSSQPPEPQPPATRGKTRTWWHPLLASLLRWQLGSHYHLEEEVPVGQKPLQIDLMLLQKEEGELPARARRVLAGFVEFLGELTLVEFKSPSDTLRPVIARPSWPTRSCTGPRTNRFWIRPAFTCWCWPPG